MSVIVFAAPSDPDGFSVLVDWDRDGDYGDVGEDVTARTIRQSPVSFSYGRASSLAPTAGGSGGLTLDNSTRDYSPRNTTSPLYGLLKPARPVSISRVVAGVGYSLFDGHTDTAPLNPDPLSRSVTLGLVDSLSEFREVNLSTALHRGVRTGEAIGLVLDAIGWPADKRDLDPGATVIPWWWEDGTDALTAMEKIVNSEGMPALLTVGVGGVIIYRDRHHQVTRAASTISQGTWRASGSLEPVMAALTVDESWSGIVNSVTRSVDVRTPQNLQPVWTSDATLTFTPGEQKVITASASDPFFDAVTPVAGTDFTQVSGTVTCRLLRTSGASAGIVLSASVGGPAVITGLQLRAFPVPVTYAVDVSASDPASVEEYGSRTLPNDLPWCGVEDAQAVLSLAVAYRSEPLPVATARFVVGRDPRRCAAILARDLSDRVTVIEPETALSGDFFIESIAHEITSEFDHAVTIQVEAAASQVDNVFRLDVPGQGADQGRLGGGLDDPATLLRLDSTEVGHRLDEGVTAT